MIDARQITPIPAEDPFGMAKHVHVKVRTPAEEETLALSAKITRLRALRLAKEAADRDAAASKVPEPHPKKRGPQNNLQK
jgi:hypothetical protein